jgi:hypothetical protein
MGKMTEQEELAMLLDLQQQNWLQWQTNESELQLRGNRMYYHLCQRYGRENVETSFLAAGKKCWTTF